MFVTFRKLSLIPGGGPHFPNPIDRWRQNGYPLVEENEASIVET